MKKYKDRILRLDDVIQISGLSRETLRRRELAGLFPARIPLGGSSIGWLESEVFTWVNELVEARDK